MFWVEPRSASSHCGSENALDQRVPVLPSVALAAGNEEFSSDDAVVGWCRARFVVPQLAASGTAGVASAALPAAAVEMREPAIRLNDATMTGANAIKRRRRSAR